MQPRNTSYALVFLLLVTLGLLHTTAARADTTCQPDPYYGTVCVAQVRFDRFYLQAYQAQQQDEWCWAASISMIWAYYGYQISQQEIVSSVYGAVVDWPAQTTSQLLGVLNGTRVDDTGAKFVSRVSGLYDATTGIDTVSYANLGAALNNNQPIMIGMLNGGGGGHAVVLTAIQYYQIPGEGVDPTGGNIIAAGIFDPWPGNGARTLNLPQDLLPAPAGGNLEFVATVNVSAAPTASSGDSSSSGNSGGGAVDPLLVLSLAVLVTGSATRRAKAGGPTRM